MLRLDFLSSAVKQAFKQVRKRAPAPRFFAAFLAGCAGSFAHHSSGRVGFSHQSLAADASQRHPWRFAPACVLRSASHDALLRSKETATATDKK
jgi:hypothetical protein